MLMPSEVHNLCVFLVKAGCATPAEVIHLAACTPPVDVAIAGHEGAKLFLANSATSQSVLLAERVDLALLGLPGLAAVLHLQVDGRQFVLAFGEAGRLLLKEDAFEERFGLLCTLNSVDPDSFRCCGEEWLECQTNAVVGRPADFALGRRMGGSNGLFVEVGVRLSGLPGLLAEYKKKFEAI